jgi:UrcA family protein
MTFVTFTRRTVPITAVVACVLFAGTVVGAEREITVDIHVSAHRLDISQPAGAQKLYQRLKYAAHLACTSASGRLAPSRRKARLNRTLRHACRAHRRARYDRLRLSNAAVRRYASWSQTAQTSRSPILIYRPHRD